MLDLLLHSAQGRVFSALTLALLVTGVLLARRPRGAELPLWIWLAPPAGLMALASLWGALSLGAGGHASEAMAVAAPLGLASACGAVLLTAATAAASWRREGWRRLTVLAALVVLLAVSASLFDLGHAFHDGLSRCTPWEPDALGAFLRGQGQVLVASGALLTCALGAALALVGWALHPASAPGWRESLGVALCLLLGSLPPLALRALSAPARDATLLARVDAFMDLIEDLPEAPPEAPGPCGLDGVWAWGPGGWSSRVPAATRGRPALLALPRGGPARALLQAPAGALALHDSTQTRALETPLGQLSRVRVLQLEPSLPGAARLIEGAEGLRLEGDAAVLPRGPGLEAALGERLGEGAPLRVAPGSTLSVDELVRACRGRRCAVVPPG